VLCVYPPKKRVGKVGTPRAYKARLVAVFTAKGCRVFTQDSILQALSIMDISGSEIMRGMCSGGLYIQGEVPHKTIEHVKSKKTTDISLYDRVHMVTGHQGERGMEWHRRNSINARYTSEDANAPRLACNGCITGGMRQTSTDHRREHREMPTRAGQAFSLDV
jgi:hypothetical protein